LTIINYEFLSEIFKSTDTLLIFLKRNYFIKSLIIGTSIIAIVFTNVTLFSKVTAESGIGKDVFKVQVSLFGITNSTNDIVTMVNVKDQTKVKLFNGENPGSEGQDRVSYIITFPNLQVDDGDPYKVCIITVKDSKISCKEGKNSPLNRPEFVDIDVSKEGKG
jgi:hypothetical protein